jgi:hypothetical protein
MGGVNYSLWLDEFLDEFYLAYPNHKTMQSMIVREPPLLHDLAADSYIGAVGEHLALRWGLEVPDWTYIPERAGDKHPRFVPDLPTLRAILLVESPYAFRRRNIFTSEEPLQRARWPRDVEIFEPMGLAAGPVMKNYGGR